MWRQWQCEWRDGSDKLCSVWRGYGVHFHAVWLCGGICDAVRVDRWWYLGDISLSSSFLLWLLFRYGRHRLSWLVCDCHGVRHHRRHAGILEGERQKRGGKFRRKLCVCVCARARESQWKESAKRHNRYFCRQEKIQRKKKQQDVRLLGRSLPSLQETNGRNLLSLNMSPSACLGTYCISCVYVWSEREREREIILTRRMSAASFPFTSFSFSLLARWFCQQAQKWWGTWRTHIREISRLADYGFTYKKVSRLR